MTEPAADVGPMGESGMDSLGETLGPGDVTALHADFRRHLEEQVATPLRHAIDRYVATLDSAVSAIADVGAEPPAPDDDATDRARTSALQRHRYTERFQERFGEALFADAIAARETIFQVLERITKIPSSLPDTVRAITEPDAEPAPDLVRPGWTQRLAGSWKRPTIRAIPVRLLADLYMAELARRLEPVANDTARLLPVTVALVRRQLHEHTELDRDEAEPDDVRALADAAVATLGREVEAVQAAIGRALHATAINVPERRVQAVAEQATTRRRRILEEWTEFETALMANVASENVLARALATMEVVVADAARQFEEARHAEGVVPLEELAEGVRSLGDGAERDLPEGDRSVVLERLARKATTLFDTELPRIDRLVGRLEQLTDAVVAELDAIPGLVPDDLHISDSAVPRIPPRPRALQLREAPLEELLRTACGGTLPRWLDRSLADAREELDAMGTELQRIRNAVDFHLKAPARGDTFSDREALDLVVGITERTIAQLEDLRAQGLVSIDTLVSGLEEQAAEEATVLRSAVANREFLRIHSEIAEEQAVRQLSTGVERIRSLGAGAGRGLGRVRQVVARLFGGVQEWAERQLGVAEVEREEMLESLEQSLLGEDQQVVSLPAMYRQLFDVEAGVPWDELLVPRDEELAVVQRAFDRWREGRPATTAVVGEKGSGKTTLIHLARRQVFDEARVVETTLGHTIDDTAEMEDRLRDLFELGGAPPLIEGINAGPATVAVIEDLHHLFIRALGGFDTLDRFLEIVAATRTTVFWVVTMDELAWKYLNRVTGIDAHFVHTVSTTDLSPERLEQAIMARHDVSGFTLWFETAIEEAQRRGLRRFLRRESGGLLTRREEQRRRYFQQLAAIAEGNILVALFYWLRSIREVKEHVLVMGSPEIIDLEFLERMPLAHLHTIAAIILHGGISERAHQRIFQLPVTESRLQLAALAESHMIFPSDDGEYKINKVLYRPFIRLLAEKNIF